MTTATTHAVRIHRPGGPEELRWEEVPLPAPRHGEARVRQHAVGLNFIDIYHRTGQYPLPLPATLGLEAAGVVEELGPGTTGLAVGDRVAYASPPAGAYAQARVIAADRLLRLPDTVDDRTAAGMMLRGMTAQCLCRRTYRVKEGDVVLVHAAAGGVGLLLCQWARHLGATVLGTVSSDAKAELARAHGCQHPIVTSREDFLPRVVELTDGKKAHVVYDAIGRDTFARSLDALRPLGMLVVYGQVSGPVPPFDVSQLGDKGCLFLTRPSLMVYTAARADYEASGRELFDMVTSGRLKVRVDQVYPLREVGRAHADLEARRTTGSTVLLPD
jgi:NADPH2:quinone reductase